MSSELFELAGDLRRADQKVAKQARAVVSKGALNVKNQLRSDLAASPHFSAAAHTVSYDIKASTSLIEAEIGAVTEGRTVGDLAHLAYFGGAHGGGGTVPDPQEALAAEEPAFIDALIDLVEPW